jgi:hypothetical protein
VIEEAGAELATSYYFRMVEADGTPLGSYAQYPSIAVPAQAPLIYALRGDDSTDFWRFDSEKTCGSRLLPHLRS